MALVTARAAGAAIAGAAGAAAGLPGLDVVFKLLFDAISNAIKENVEFKDTMKEVQETLNKMEPEIMEITKHDNEFDRPNQLQDLIDLMEKGKKLVDKCKKVHKWNAFKKSRYTCRLVSLQASLQARLARYFSFKLQKRIAAIGRETLSDAKKALEVAQRQEKVGKKILQRCDQMSAQLTQMEKKMNELADRTASKMPSLSSGSGALGANASPVSLNCGPSPPPQELELSAPMSIANNAVSAVPGNKPDQSSKKSRKRSNRTSDTETETATRSSKSQRRLFRDNNDDVDHGGRRKTY